MKLTDKAGKKYTKNIESPTIIPRTPKLPKEYFTIWIVIFS